MEPNKNDVTTIELMKFIKGLSKRPCLNRRQVWMLERAEKIIHGRVQRAKVEFGLV